MSRSIFLQIGFLFAVSVSYAETRPEDIVYLASFPRSGNHWVRYLVEEASSIATSSVYRDRNIEHPHYPNRFLPDTYSPYNGFSGFCRNPKTSEFVLLKTHYPFLPKPINFTETPKICLVRNPIDSFYSFYIYRQKYVFKEKQVSYGRIPFDILTSFVNGWRDFYEFWEAQENVLFIRYEDLYENPKFYLSKILDVLAYEVKQRDVERAVKFFPPTGGILKHIVYYEEEDVEFIRRELGDLLEKYHYDL